MKPVSNYISWLEQRQRIPSGMAFLVASEVERPAVEFTQLENGAFTHVLLKGLRGEADGFGAIGPHDGVITFGEIREYMRKRLPQETQRVFGRALHPDDAVTSADPLILQLPLAKASP